MENELEGDFIYIKIIYSWQQVWTPKYHPCHDLPQAYGEIKSIFLVWIHPTDSFLSQPSTSMSINDRWLYQCKQTNKQSMKII